MRTAVLCLLLAVPAAAQLPPDRLAAVEAATVFIKLTTPKGPASGSGFVVRKTTSAAYIATNFHVACPLRERNHKPGEARESQVRVVFASGSGTEWERPAVVVAEDFDRDLAVLKVIGDTFPDPLELADPQLVTRTLKVHVCGFPFGEMLTAGAKHPTLSIGDATVSGSLRDGAGREKWVQLNGALNPGNSGGPVVSSDGKVVGVAVRTVKDAGLGMAVPVRDLRTLLDGRLGRVELSGGTAAGGKPVVRVQVPVLDPYGLVKDVRVTVQSAASGQRLVVTDANGRYVKLSATPETLTVADGWATGTVTLPRDGNPTLWVQLAYKAGGDEYQLAAAEYPMPRSGGDKPTPPRPLTPTPPATGSAPAGPTLADVNRTPDKYIGKRLTVDGLAVNGGTGGELDIRYDAVARPANVRFTAAKSLADQVRAAVGTGDPLSVRVGGTVVAADGGADKRPVFEIDEVTPLAADGTAKGTLRAVVEPVVTPVAKKEPEVVAPPPATPTPTPAPEPVAEPAPPAAKKDGLPIVPAVAAGLVGLAGVGFVVLRGRRPTPQPQPFPPQEPGE